MAQPNFYNKAKHHQEKFRNEYLKLDRFDTYPTMLTDEDALKGYNFYIKYPGMLDAVRKRFNGFRKPLYKNMLRSEHIPFNLFVPLKIEINAKPVISFFNRLFPFLNIDSITDIDFEKSPERLKFSKGSFFPLPLFDEEKYLDDSTSFDVMVTYKTNGHVGCLGIEVKYTEKSYPYGATEKLKMYDNDENSLYHQTHTNSKIYLPDSISLLREKKLKQLWRNHLLGLKMLQKGDINNFTSVHLYPNGNSYQRECVEAYHETLLDTSKQSFVGITFEKFIETGKECFKNNFGLVSWLEYLEVRYIVK
jgi:hypothetical protein